MSKKATGPQAIKMDENQHEIRRMRRLLSAQWDSLDSDLHMLSQRAQHDQDHPLTPAAVLRAQETAMRTLTAALARVDALILSLS